MRRIAIGFAALAMLAGGCDVLSPTPNAPRANVPAAMSDAGGRMMVRTEILFGLTRDDGTAIDEFAWDKFVDDSVGVWFPSGFTIEDAKGRWRGPDGKIASERSKVLIIFHDGSDGMLRKIDDIRRLFMQRFGQRSVIRASGEVWLAF